ncbi:hypothetical protein C9439_00945 [archaeon SCG-AAA382B04]|nr:hypothetical protein C9439_00945 [archaeon SCG-AAA382B04]
MIDQTKRLVTKIRRELEQPTTWLFLSKLSLPFMLAGIYLGIVYLFFEWRTLYPLIGVYFFPPLGKETVIPMGVGFGVSPSLMAFSIAYVDIVVGLFFALNFDLLKKIPFLGYYIKVVEGNGRKLIRNKDWLRKFAFSGLVLLVMVPFQGSGAVTASVIGRLTGLKPMKVWLSIIIGAITGCIIIAYFTDLIIYISKINTILAIIVLILVFLVSYMSYKKYWKN